ncbi:MAG: molybdopterin-dependent oxidoreductase, partial [Acidobacteriota bacterium]
AKNAGRAVGIACGMKNSGIGNGAPEWGKARLMVEYDGTVSLYNGYTEMGQGLLTVLVQCAVEVTGLPASIFKPRVDSTFDLDCGQTTGSRGTMLGGLAVKAAAEKLKIDLDALAGEAVADMPMAAAGGGGTSTIPGLGGEAPTDPLSELAGRVYEGEVLIDDTTAPGQEKNGKIKTHTSYGFATQVCILDEKGRIERVIAAHDVGRAINPSLCEGQVEGSVHMGLGYALTEELPCPDGMPATFKLRELGVLRAQDMPAVEVMLIEDPEPEGPFGAKGVGEIGLVPTASAVAGALAAYDGIRRFTLPMKDSPAARAMSVGRIRRQ